jgi:hypothetical protein
MCCNCIDIYIYVGAFVFGVCQNASKYGEFHSFCRAETVFLGFHHWISEGLCNAGKRMASF